MQTVQFVGALLWLCGYLGLTRNRFDTQSGFYLLLNQLAATLLVIAAVYYSQYGFILLNAVFWLVNGWETWKRLYATRRAH